MTTYSLDAETFINEIKKYQELWGAGSEGHRYKSAVKRRAWSEVARMFITDFDSMNELEKFDVFRKLHSKWRNIRDAYVRNLKRKTGQREYMYAKHLTFLNSRYVGRTNEQTDDESSDEDKITDKTKKTEVLSCQSDDEPTTVNVKRQRIEKRANIEFVDTPNLVTNLPDFHPSGEDEDKSFFNSLLPAVREFNLDQKLEFRCEVLKLIKYIRSNSSKMKAEQNLQCFDS